MGGAADPVLVEIVKGTLASVEAEVETAIARTSRSPMGSTRRTARCTAMTFAEILPSRWNG